LAAWISAAKVKPSISGICMSELRCQMALLGEATQSKARLSAATIIPDCPCNVKIFRLANVTSSLQSAAASRLAEAETLMKVKMAMSRNGFGYSHYKG